MKFRLSRKPPKFDPKFEHDNPSLEAHLADLFSTRTEQIKKLEKALPGDALEYELVEEWQEKKIVWYFQKRKVTA